ncbi:MAG: type IV secretory system conjugative DNA transfer family protein [Acidimicrobiales bacterium]
MSEPTWLGISWPREVEADQLVAAARLLAGTGGPYVLIVEAVGRAGRVRHQIGVHPDRAGWLSRQLRAGLPGSVITPGDRVMARYQRAVSLRFSSKRRALRADPEGAGRALLSALSATGTGETLTLQYVLGPTLHPEAIASNPGHLGHDSWIAELAALPFPPKKADAEQRAALVAKRAEPGWKAVGRIGVSAETDARRYQLVRGVLAAMRLAEAPGAALLAHRTRPVDIARARRPLLWPLRLNAIDLATVAGWPTGSTIDLPVERTASRLVAPSRQVPSRGRVVATATAAHRGRHLSLSVPASLRHLHALGPTGTGKSTLLLNLIAQDMEAGRAVVVIEPKGTLIDDVLARVPDERVNDVVVLDPGDAEAPVGLNPLAPEGRSPELVADQLLAVFRQLSPSWGPRLEQLLHASLLTLARTPGTTLVSLPLLLSNEAFRRRVTGRLDDPVALSPYWAAFEQWSPAERATASAPILNRLLPFLQRPQLRAVLGQRQPRFGVRQVFTERRILLVNLSKGTLGASTASLLGGLVVSQLWQATLGRSAVAATRRHPVFVTLDEFQDYLALPVDLADALGMARGLGVGFAMGHQHLAQLDTATRASVLANARSRVAFQLAPDDARVLAANTSLDAEDFTSLGAYECYVQLVAGDAVQPWASARTLPPTEATIDPKLVRQASRANFGRPRAEVDAEIEAAIFGSRQVGGSDIGRRPRRPRTNDDAGHDGGAA